MVDLLERLLTSVEVKFSFETLAFEGEAYRGRASVDQLSAFSDALQIAQLCDIALRVKAAAIDEKAEHGFRQLVYGNVGGDWLRPEALRLGQRRFLISLGFEFENSNTFRLQVLNGEIRVEIEEFEALPGSLWKKKVVRVFLTDFDEIRRTVIASVFTAMLLSPSPVNPNNGFHINSQEGTYFICTSNAEITGGYAQIQEDALKTLSPPNGVDAVASTIKARQFCLAAAGFDPGPIDGIYGPKTKAAEEAYSNAHGGINVDWSQNFSRHILLYAAKHHEAEKWLAEKSKRNSKRQRRGKSIFDD